MTRLEEIIATGNSGWQAGLVNAIRPGPDRSHIRCVDGYRLSVLAGGGAYCTPRPQLVFQGADGRALTGTPSAPLPYEVEHDFPGPYTHVEVGVLSGSPDPEPWEAWEDCKEWSGSRSVDQLRVYADVPVELVRALVAAHGGEVTS